MKRIYYLALTFSLIFYSCEKEPKARFSVDSAEPEVGQKVFFNNESDNATDFEWDFGDGVISNSSDPTHVYTGTGSFDVTLTVWSKNGNSDKSTLNINVQIPTLLEIEVLEYYQEYSVPDASVYLYPTIGDWENQTHVEAEGFTDKDGIVVFSHLGPYVYYVDVWEQNHDNYTLKTEDVAFIRTDEIIPHKINRFTAWVDIASHSKGSRSGDRTGVVVKLERKADSRMTTIITTEENWQVLYDKSIKVK